MSAFSLSHLAYLAVTFAFIGGGMWLLPKCPKKAQDIIFILLALLGSGGIFYRYAMNFSWSFHPQTLAFEWMQVCNFNFLLLPLMLIPKNELARQYSVFFSLPAAASALFSVSSSWKNYAWYDQYILNSWLNHTFAVALPLFMIAARRSKPQKKYVLPVLACVFVYFSVSALVQYIMITNGTLTIEESLSFIFKPGKTQPFSLLYALIPLPYVYLYPMLAVLWGYFFLFAKAFEKYRVNDYSSNGDVR